MSEVDDVVTTTQRVQAPAGISLAGLTVGLVGINYAPETTGIAPYTTAMAQALRTAGAEVNVITGVPHYPQWKVEDPTYRRGLRWVEQHDGVRVTRVRHAVPAIPTLRSRAKMESSFAAAATAAVLRDRSEVLLAVSPALSGAAAVVAGGRGRATGVVVQDLIGNGASQTGTTGDGVGSTIARAEYRLLRRFDRVGVVTPRFGAVLTEAGIDPARLVDLPNFTHIMPTVATVAEARARLGWRQDVLTVVHTGNMGMKQGLENVVEAAKVAARRGLPMEFVLVGEGSRRSLLAELSAGVPTLRIVPPLSGEDYPYALAAADQLLVNERPDVAEMSMPSKVTSYCAAGRPIVAAVAAGGITHSVLEAAGAARLAVPGDGAALVDAVQAVATDGILRDGLVAAAGLLHDTHFSAEAATDRYRGFVAGLAGIVTAIPAQRVGTDG